MNRVVMLELAVAKRKKSLRVTSTMDGWLSDESEIDEAALEWLRSVTLRTLGSGEFEKSAALVRRLILGSRVGPRLQELVDAAAQQDPARREFVRVCINTQDDRLQGVPWELAFALGDLGRTVSVARVRHNDLPDDSLLADPTPVVRELEALTSEERRGFTAFRRALLALGAQQALARPTFEEATSPRSVIDPCDVLQLTGHGGLHGGLMLFGKGSRQGSAEESLADRELAPAEICALVARFRAAVVVVAACGTAEQGELWSLGEQLVTLSTVKAVVSMREPIEASPLADFCVELYAQLSEGAPIDTAVLRARWRLPASSSSIPQLRLGVRGELTLWKQPQGQAKPSFVAVGAGGPDFRTLAVTGIAGELWGVNLNGDRIATYQYDGEWDPGAPAAGASLAVSADGRVAVSLHEDRLDVAWLAVDEKGELVAKRPAWVVGLRLPAPLRDADARLLAVALVHGARVRVTIATRKGTWWDLASAAHGWGEPYLLDHDIASAALDLPTDRLLVVGGRLRLPDGRRPIFAGSHNAAAVDCASWEGTQLAVRLDRVGGRLSLRQRAHHEGRWVNPAVTDFALPDQLLHVSVVRQLTRGHRLTQLLVVDTHGVAKTVDIGQLSAVTSRFP